MNFKFFTKAIAIATIVGTTYANAAVIIDNGDFTTVDGVDWLDMSFTDGKSYYDVLSLLESGQQLDGWRVASFAEVANMYTAFGYTYTPNTNEEYIGNVGYEDVLASLGATYEYTMEEDGIYDALTYGMVSDYSPDYNPDYQQTVMAGHWWGSEGDIWQGVAEPVRQMDETEWLGTYLTRAGVSSVPEPSIHAIFALALMGLASRRFKKQS